MKSMTGFGRATAALGTYSLCVQVSSVNRKTLDLTQRLPAEWSALETDIADLVRKVASRGKVHVAMELTGESGNSGVSWDDVAVQSTLDRLTKFSKARGEFFEVSADLLWSIASAHRKSATAPALDDVRDAVLVTVTEALDAFVEMRAKEGAALLADFTTRLATLSEYIAAIAERAPKVPVNHREQLMKRLRDAGLELDLADERVLKELALFADRCDIAEEITRLRSHLEQFTMLLKTNGEIGRKSEFILQEISREVHTIGSKANDLELSRHVIELKNELERIREQVANVE